LYKNTQYDKFITAIPESMKAIFDINTITGLRYIELQRLYDNPAWYYKERNQIILPREAQKKEKQKLPKRTIYLTALLIQRIFLPKKRK
jgi:hypothetical protein